MKAHEALAITRTVILKKDVLPKYFKMIEEASKEGLYQVDIGKPSSEVMSILRSEGFKVYCGESDGDAHSARCLRYMCSWKE